MHTSGSTSFFFFFFSFFYLLGVSVLQEKKSLLHFPLCLSWCHEILPLLLMQQLTLGSWSFSFLPCESSGWMVVPKNPPVIRAIVVGINREGQRNMLCLQQAGPLSMVLGKDTSGGRHPEVMIPVIPYDVHVRYLILPRIV